MNWVICSEPKEVPFHTKSYWPSWKSTDRISRAIKDGSSYDSTFTVHSVKVIYTSDKYDKARSKLRQAEETSEVETDQDCTETLKRTRKPNSRYESEGEEERSPRKSPRKTHSQSKLPRTPFVPGPILPPRLPKPTNPSHVMSPPKTTLHSLAAAESSSPQRLPAADSKMIRLLEEIKADVRLNTKLIVKLSKDRHQTTMPSLPGNIVLPISSLQQLKEVEEELNNEDSLKALVANLSLVGGETVETNTRRVMAHVMANDVCVNFNWVGKGSKEAFKSLKLKKAILDAVRSCKSSATDHDIEKIMSEWLRYAKDRHGGRKKREEKKAATAAAATAAAEQAAEQY